MAADDDLLPAKWGARDTGLVSPAPHSEADLLWDGEGRMPERTLVGGAAVPDLTRIHTSRWAEVLAVLPERIRMEATYGPGLRGRGVNATDLARSLPPAPSDRARQALYRSPAIPAPAAPPLTRRGRQISLRVRPEEYAELEVAARLLGTKPTQLVRMLALNGMRRVLAEHDAAIAEASRGA